MDKQEKEQPVMLQSTERQDTPESLHLPDTAPEQPRAGVKQRAQRRKRVKADQPSETVVVKDTFLEWLRVRTLRRARACVAHAHALTGPHWTGFTTQAALMSRWVFLLDRTRPAS